MTSKTKVEEIKDPQGGRNFIRRGDGVKVDPGPGDKTSFKAIFMDATLGADGEVVEITVYGGRRYDPAKPIFEQDGTAATRTVRPSRVHRMSQAHIEGRR